ncbi:MAG TPA: DUF3667 domain-containing protein [Candidatus Angelobacter sp.]|jgi:predicted RNA-binding Zn-ribbon protein involved in translation (DUF1610 family)|nr:DUF3667 domain-containing protein [Candidatus Angelobacter sp.]
MGTMLQENAASHQQTATCVACGETVTQQFCPKCGEQKFDRHHFSFKHFVHHSSHELFHLDSKIFRTIRYLFSKPAFVTAEYLAGKRSRYVNPLRLYLVCFALATFLTSTYHPVLDFGRISKIDRTGNPNQLFEKLAHRKGVSEEVLIERLNERLHFYYEGSKILNALAMAWLLAVFYRKQNWYFGEHAVTALYFLSFTALLSMVRWPFWLALGAPIQGARSTILLLVFLAVVLPYLWVTLRQLYGEDKWKTAVKSVLVYGGTQLAIVITTVISVALALVHTLLAH